MFQSIAGTEAANASFGISLKILQEGYEAGLSQKRGTLGNNLMYFETGQGSALSANAHHGVDQQTCETRAYAVARHFKPFLVNTVVGFIGPEYLYNGKQIIRAAWKTTSAASCSACRWVATSATPTMPRPTRTTWTCS